MYIFYTEESLHEIYDNSVNTIWKHKNTIFFPK